jgi:hypothetical protein
MKNIGIKLFESPFRNHIKIADLLYYEGAILSHFVDEFDNNYLYYWIDFNENANRWLVFKFNKAYLSEYLNGIVTLKDFFYEQQNQFVFSVDVDKDYNYTNIRMFSPYELPEDYTPKSDSFFTHEIPIAYRNQVQKLAPTDLINALLANAVYLSCNSKHNGHGNFIFAKDASEFLYNMTDSYTQHTGSDFDQNFYHKYRSIDRAKTAKEQALEQTPPILVYNGVGSFKIGLNSDYLTLNTDMEIAKWKRTIARKYKEDVVDVDYDSPDEVKRKIIQKYPDEVERRKIFNPFIASVNNQNYTVRVAESRNDEGRAIPKIKKERIVEIIPPPKKDKPLETDVPLKIVGKYYAIPANKEFSDVSAKDLREADLFTLENIPTQQPFSKIEHKGYKIFFKLPIQTQIGVNGSLITLTYPDLNISVSGKGKEEYLIKFYNAFISRFNKELDTPDSEFWANIDGYELPPAE